MPATATVPKNIRRLLDAPCPSRPSVHATKLRDCAANSRGNFANWRNILAQEGFNIDTIAYPPTLEKTAAAAILPKANRDASPCVAEVPASAAVLDPEKDDGWTTPEPVILTDGTHVQLYKDGSALAAAYEAIRHAKVRICLEVYIFHSDETGWNFANLLCDKSREGVAVYVIYDSFGSIDTDAAMFAQMKAAGVRLREFHPIRPWDCKFSWRPANRDHRKLLVIDNHIAGMGGLNLGAEYGGSNILRPSKSRCEQWRDNAIGLVGPAAAHLLRSFAKTWHYCDQGGRIRKAELIHHLEDGDFGLLASVATRNSPLRPMLHRLLRGAKHSIHLTMAYFAPDDDLINELCRASRRGVRVRLMLPGRCDIKLLHIAARSFYETLLNNGIQIFERQGVVLHAKTIVIDDCITVIGSTNLDYRSIEYNCELSAIIRNATFGKQIRQLFHNDMRFAERITLSRWRYRPTWDRLVQWAVSRARYLL